MMLTLAYLRPEEGQSNWTKRRQGFQPCFEAGIRELPLLKQPVVQHEYTTLFVCWMTGEAITD